MNGGNDRFPPISFRSAGRGFMWRRRRRRGRRTRSLSWSFSDYYVILSVAFYSNARQPHIPLVVIAELHSVR